MPIELHGYQYSVYSWIARLALHEKGQNYTWVEINPFAEAVPPDYISKHPFALVPALADGDFVVYETSAITRYVDAAFDGPALQIPSPRYSARINQIISVVDSYAYWPLVRQVFSHGLFRPRLGRPVDEAEFRQGLESAPKVLAALEQLAAGGNYLVADTLSLADIHLAPMIGYFTSVPEAEALLKQYPKLSVWWAAMAQRKAFGDTKPILPGPRT